VHYRFLKGGAVRSGRGNHEKQIRGLETNIGLCKSIKVGVRHAIVMLLRWRKKMPSGERVVAHLLLIDGRHLERQKA